LKIFTIRFSLIHIYSFFFRSFKKRNSTNIKKMSQVQATQQPAAKPVKAIKAKTSKPAEHPKYIVMIAEALKKLNERSGSSRQALLKYIIANFKVDPKTANQHLRLALKAGVKAGTLKQSKGVGASGSFKLGDKLKEQKKPKKVVKPKVAKPKTTKAAAKPKKNVKKVVKPKAPKATTGTAKPKAAKPAKKVVKKDAAVKKTKTTEAKPKKTVKQQTKEKKVKVQKPKVVKAAKPAAPKVKKAPVKKVAAAKPKAN
jgi:histone H1/5